MEDRENQVIYSNKKTGRDVLLGVFLGALAMLSVCCVVLLAAVGMGYVNFGVNGEIYITEDAKAEDGIGTKAEAKLNALDKALDSFYFDDVDDEEVIDKICKAYVDAYGDRYTTYYTQEEYQQLTESNNGTYYGIGVVVRKNEDGTIKVVETYEGAPGKEAGMRANDTIIAVNGISVLDRDLESVVTQIRGEEGSTVDIELRREGVADSFAVTVERRAVDYITVESKMLQDNIGLITIGEFDKVTVKQFGEAYDALTQQGMTGLIVDIRANPGGLLSSVVDILDNILPPGRILYTEDESGKKQEYVGHNTNQITIPMVVLVDGDSASASEIFAGAVQDYGKATIVGTKTFGKGIVQTIRPLTDGSAVKFTTSKYYTAMGQDIHGNGVIPDIVVELSDEFRALTEYDETKDNQLQAAITEVNRLRNNQ